MQINRWMTKVTYTISSLDINIQINRCITMEPYTVISTFGVLELVSKQVTRSVRIGMIGKMKSAPHT
jgi:hypothetical protein